MTIIPFPLKLFQSIKRPLVVDPLLLNFPNVGHLGTDMFAIPGDNLGAVIEVN